MHQNAFGGRAPPGPTGELERSTRPLAAVRGGEGKGRRGVKGRRDKRKGEGMGRVRKGEGKEEEGR